MAENTKLELEERLRNLLQSLAENDAEIEYLKKMQSTSSNRLEALSEIAFDVLKNCLIEKDEGTYILTGRMNDNFVQSLKSAKIIRFDEDDYLWYINDIQVFVKRIEHRIKRKLDVSCAYFYKNVTQHNYENRLAAAINKFDKISAEIEWIEKTLQGEQTEPLHLYMNQDKDLYYQLTNDLTQFQQEYDELVTFVNTTENIPTSIFKLLADQQETLLKAIEKTKFSLDYLKHKYN